MALAIRYNQLIKSGHIRNYVELPQVGEVSNTRITQIMNLRLLAPDIQEAILYLPTDARDDRISERDLRPVVAEPNWTKQRTMWAALLKARF